MNTLILL